MDLSIVIVNWNTLGLLRRCLETVYDTSGALTAEVWVVDNASSDGSADMVEREFPSAHLIRNSENASGVSSPRTRWSTKGPRSARPSGTSRDSDRGMGEQHWD